MGEGIRKYGTPTRSNRKEYTRPTTTTKVRVMGNAEAVAKQKHAVNAGLNPKEVATLKKLEDKNRLRKTEQANFVDEDGNVYFSKNGSKSRVKFYPYEAQLMEDKIMTHNHPQEGTFGSGLASQIGIPINGVDVSVAMKYNAKEVRASAQGYVFSVKRPKGGWQGNPDEVAKDFQSAFNSSRAFLYKYVGGAKTDKEAYNRQGRYNVGRQNEIMRKLAKKYGFIYSRAKMS